MIWLTITKILFGVYIAGGIALAILSYCSVEDADTVPRELFPWMFRACCWCGGALTALALGGVALQLFMPEMEPLGAKAMQHVFYEGSLLNFAKYPRAVGGYMKGSWNFLLLAAALCFGTGFLCRSVSRRKRRLSEPPKRKWYVHVLNVLAILVIPAAAVYFGVPVFYRIMYGREGVWAYFLSRKAVVEYASGELTRYWQPMAIAFGAAGFGTLFGCIWYGLTLVRGGCGAVRCVLVYLLCAAATVLFTLAFYPLLSMILPILKAILVMCILAPIGMLLGGVGSGAASRPSGAESSYTAHEDRIRQEAAEREQAYWDEQDRIRRIVDQVHHDGTAKHLDPDDYAFYRKLLDERKIAGRDLRYMGEGMDDPREANTRADDELRDSLRRLD